MKRTKKNREKTTNKVLLLTALTNLVAAIINLMKTFR